VRDPGDDYGAIAGRVVAAGRDHRVGNASAGDCPDAEARRLSYLTRQPQSGSATQQARPPVANRWRRACSASGCVSRLTRETREVQRPASTTLPALAVRDRSAAVV